MAPIPKTQKALIFETNGGPLLYKTDYPVPTPASDEILVNVKYSGVCHTDLHAWKGDWPLEPSFPLLVATKVLVSLLPRVRTSPTLRLATTPVSSGSMAPAWAVNSA